MANDALHESGSFFGKQGKLFEKQGESTDLALMVDALAQEESSPWDASRIRDALIIEAGVDPATESCWLHIRAPWKGRSRYLVLTS